MTILLVDDHDLVLKGMTAVLREHFREAELLPAADGRQAVEAAVNYDIDLAILDLELPDMSGFDLIERLRGISPGIKIVVNTVHEEIWAMNRLRQCAVDGIVFKSVDSSALVQTVRNVLEGLPSSCQAGTGPGVSSKELEVLRLIADGLDSQKHCDAAVHLHKHSGITPKPSYAETPGLQCGRYGDESRLPRSHPACPSQEDALREC